MNQIPMNARPQIYLAIKRLLNVSEGCEPPDELKQPLCDLAKWAGILCATGTQPYWHDKLPMNVTFEFAGVKYVAQKESLVKDTRHI